MNQHPTGERLRQWLDGRLSEADSEEIEAHLTTCSDYCPTILANIAGADSSLTKSLPSVAGASSLPTPSAPLPPAVPPIPKAPLCEPEDLIRIQALLAAPCQPDELGRLGDYRVLKVLGSGGMGVVFLAEDVHLRRRVALKLMKPDLAASSRARERFLREAQATAALAHDNVVAVYQVGEANGLAFLAMPLLQGESLEARLKREGRLPAAEVLRIGREVAEGLAAAHKGGLIHRDVKPANLWLEALPRGGTRVKVLDFGLARESDGEHLTQTGAVVGTPAYMAPEQASGQKVDCRCDLFSLGCVLYRMCTSQPPFQGADAISTLVAVRTQTPQSPREINPDVSRGLSDLIMRLLTKKPEGRPATAEAVAAELEILAQKDVKRRPPAVTAPPMKIGWFVAACVVGVALLGLAGLWASGAFWAKTNKGVAAEVNGPNPDVYGNGEKASEKEPAQPKASAPLPAPFGPLDNLDADMIPAEERYPWQPKELVAVLGQHRGRHWREVRSVAYSPDGKQLASGGLDNVVRLWDATTLRELAVLKGHTGIVNSVAYSLDGKILASCSDDHTVRLWDLSDVVPKELTVLQGHQDWVRSVAFSPDKKTLATASWDRTVLLWDLSALPRKSSTTLTHAAGVNSVAFSPDGKRMAAGLEDRTVQLWKVTNNDADRWAVLPGAGNRVTSVAFASGGTLLAAGSQDGDIRVYNVSQEPKQISILKGHIQGFKEGWLSGVLCVCFSPDGRLLASGGSEDHTVRLWKVGKEEVEDSNAVELHGHSSAVSGVSFAPDGRTLASCGGHYPNVYDNSVRLWDLTDAIPRERNPVDNPMGRVYALSFASDGKLLAAGCQAVIGQYKGQTASVRLWSIAGAAPGKETILRHPFEAYGVAFAPNGKTLAVGINFDSQIRLWDVPGGQPQREPLLLSGHESRVNAVAFAPDGKFLASAGYDGTARLWKLADIHEPEQVAMFKARGDTAWSDPDVVWSVAFAPGGKALASGSWDEKVRIWDLEAANPQNPTVLEGHKGGALTVAFAPQGKTLAVGSGDGGIRVWDFDSGKSAMRLVLTEHTDSVSSIAFAPDGKTLASVGLDGRLVLWDMASGNKLLMRSLPGPIHAVAFAADGRHLALGNGNGTIYILRLAQPPAPAR